MCGTSLRLQRDHELRHILAEILGERELMGSLTLMIKDYFLSHLCIIVP